MFLTQCLSSVAFRLPRRHNSPHLTIRLDYSSRCQLAYYCSRYRIGGRSRGPKRHPASLSPFASTSVRNSIFISPTPPYHFHSPGPAMPRSIRIQRVPGQAMRGERHGNARPPRPLPMRRSPARPTRPRSVPIGRDIRVAVVPQRRQATRTEIELTDNR